MNGGDRDFNDVVLTVQMTSNSPPIGRDLQNQARTEVIDLRSLTTPPTANLTIASEAAYTQNTAGFYRINDTQGRVTDPLTGTTLMPGDAGYAQAALRQQILVVDRQGLAPLEMPPGTLLAPFLIANNTVDGFLSQNPSNQPLTTNVAYFAYLNANPDNLDHVRLLGDNTFGFEDLLGGGDQDFNDIIVQVQIT